MGTPDNEQTKRIDFNSHYEVRGYFIDQFTFLETMMDMYLGWHAHNGCKHDTPQQEWQKNVDIRTVFIDRLTFESKRTAIKHIVDRKCNDDFRAGKHGNKKKSYKNLFEDIGKMGRIRNFFAHYQVMMPWPDKKHIIKLVQGRDDFHVIEYTYREYETFINTINRCTQELMDLVKNE